jgi:hypothetical protein
VTLPRILAPALLLAGLSLVYLATAGGHLYSPDEEVMFRATEALVTRGSLAIQPMQMGFGTRPGRKGGEYPQYGLGNSVAAIPLYLLGGAVTHLFPGDELREILGTRSLVNSLRYDYATPLDYARRFAVSHMNIFVTLAQVWVLYLFALALTRHVPGAVMAGLTYGLATQAWPQAKTFFSEPLATLCLTAGAYLIWTGLNRRSLLRLWFSGGLLGYALFTRLDSVVALPGLAVLFYLALVEVKPDVPLETEEERGDPHPLSPLLAHVAVAVPLLLFIALVLGLNVWKFGSPFSTGYEDQAEGFHFSASLAESLPGYLLSPGRSIFLHSPPVLLGVIGFVALFRRAPALSIGVLITCLATLLFHAKWQNWSGGWDWGPRHIFSLIAWSMIPLAALLGKEARAPVRIAAILLFFVGLAVQVIAVSENPIEFYEVYYRPHIEDGRLVEGRGFTIARANGERIPAGNALMWHRRYLPWSGYPAMLDEGIHDLFWLRWHQWRQSQREDKVSPG